MNGSLLELKDISKYFGGLAAVHQLDLTVDPGEIHGLIGPNGAGKTTTFSIISGELSPSEGQVIFEGSNIAGLPAHKTAARGIVRSFQLNTLFPNLTVLDNVLVGLHLKSRIGFLEAILNTGSNRRKERELAEEAMKTLHFMGLADLAGETAHNLPHGHQRSLGIAIAVAAKPRLLLLDEPLTGMNPTEVTGMLEIIRRIRDNFGTTIVVVEHNMKAVMALCERLTVINFGRKIAEGPPEKIQSDEAVIEAYLGTEEDAA